MLRQEDLLVNILESMQGISISTVYEPVKWNPEGPPSG